MEFSLLFRVGGSSKNRVGFFPEFGKPIRAKGFNFTPARERFILLILRMEIRELQVTMQEQVEKSNPLVVQELVLLRHRDILTVGHNGVSIEIGKRAFQIVRGEFPDRG